MAQRLGSYSKAYGFPTGHGSPYDRGHADSYYRRARNPHKGGVGGDSGPRIEELTEAEIEQYNLGYEDNEADGDFKNWGYDY